MQLMRAGSRRSVVVISLAVTASIVAASLAGAHGGANSRDYRSTVTAISPSSLPIEAIVKGGDDRIRIRNEGSEALLIYGYATDEKSGSSYVKPNEYVRIQPDGVWVNHASTAFVLNQERYGSGAKAPKVGVPPRYVREVRGVPSYTFHDHRIHWMSTSPPPSIDTGDPKRQKVFDWKIPVRYGETRGEIRGTLVYVGGRQRGLSAAQWIVVGILAAMVAAFIVDRVRRRRTNSAGVS